MYKTNKLSVVFCSSKIFEFPCVKATDLALPVATYQIWNITEQVLYFQILSNQMISLFYLSLQKNKKLIGNLLCLLLPLLRVFHILKINHLVNCYLKIFTLIVNSTFAFRCSRVRKYEILFVSANVKTYNMGAPGRNRNY